MVLPSHVDHEVVHCDTAAAQGVEHVDAIEHYLLAVVIAGFLGVDVPISYAGRVVDRDELFTAPAVVSQVLMEGVTTSATLPNSNDRLLAHQGLSRLDRPAREMEEANAVAQSLIDRRRVLDGAKCLIVQQNRVTLASFGRVSVQSESLDLQIQHQ